jgi:hypothetical protein
MIVVLLACPDEITLAKGCFTTQTPLPPQCRRPPIAWEAWLGAGVALCCTLAICALSWLQFAGGTTTHGASLGPGLRG